ncbi:hypothetical protein [Sphingobium sp. EM0848]|uniref:hypothetical protein n=1 Tax=Sphingobium sp. EM0848 TaxID=2743473 RepID=UPI00159C531C|nr:hypothetical protein [Sphingobium sp. EM0848]
MEYPSRLAVKTHGFYKLLFGSGKGCYERLSGFSSARSDRETIVLPRMREYGMQEGDLSFQAALIASVVVLIFLGWRIFGRGG